MMGRAWPDLLPALYWCGVALLIVWNLVAAGQASRVRLAPQWLASTTAAAGFFVLPALLVALLTTSTLDGRTLHVIAWLWPATAVLAAFQCSAALITRQTPQWIAAPATVYGLLVAALATARWLTGLGVDTGVAGNSLLAAQQSLLTPLLGSNSMATGQALLVPIVAPLFPPRWITGQIARPLLAVGAAACATLLLVVALPRAVRSVSGFDNLALLQQHSRPEAGQTVGLRVFGRLAGAPPTLAVRNDLALVDSLSAGVLMVTVMPTGTSIRALDSLERVLAPYRRDTVPVQLGISLALERRNLKLAPELADSLLAARVEMLSRIVRVLLPDVVFPLEVATESPAPGSAGQPGSPPDAWLSRYYHAAADEIHRLRPRTRVGLTLNEYSARDSALYEWAVSDASPVEIVALELFPDTDGAAGFEARLTTADRWMTNAGGPMPHWVVAGSYPYVFGERNQELALQHARTWASRAAGVRAFVVADAADYGRLTGLRAAGGRIRFSLESFRDNEPDSRGLMTVP